MMVNNKPKREKVKRMKNEMRKLPPIFVRSSDEDDGSGPDHDDYGSESWP